MAQAIFPDDVFPPEGIYDSRESLLAAINSWAKPRGYAFTTGKSSKTPNGRVKVVFACDRNKLPPSISVERNAVHVAEEQVAGSQYLRNNPRRDFMGPKPSTRPGVRYT
jgi:hypothetical protein